jgi:hypothetical protein
MDATARMDDETITATEGDRKRKADTITPADNVAEAAEAPVVTGGGVEEDASATTVPTDGEQEDQESSTATILAHPTQQDDSSMQVGKDPKESDVKEEKEAEAPPAQNSTEKTEATTILPPGSAEATEKEAAVSNAPADVATPIDTSDEPPAQSEDKDESMKLNEELDEEDNGRAEATSMEVAGDEAATPVTAAKPDSPSTDSKAAPVTGSNTSTPPISSSDLPNQPAPPPDARDDANVDNAMKLSKANDGLVNDHSDPSYKSVRYAIIENDASPAALIKLVGLKSLFAKQLPKMPRAYIARLVFDRRHVSLAILSSDPTVRDTDEEIIGAICYRPFHEQRFAEIAFCTFFF